MHFGHVVAEDVQTLSDLLDARAAASPHAPGYVYLSDGENQELSLTYLQLQQQAKAIAATLQGLGMVGERAVLLYPPGLDFVAAVLGCMYAGAVAVPAYPPRTSQPRAKNRLASILDDARPEVILTHSKLSSTVRDCVGDRNVVFLSTDEIPADRATQWRDLELRRDQLACLQYTSGSTAAPKGVMLTHGNLLHNLESIRKAFAHSANSRGVIWLPPYHDMGLIGGVLQPLYAGFPVVLMAPAAFTQKPIRWLRAISHYKATTSGGPNFAYDLCTRSITEEEKSQLDLSHWDVAFNGAEPIDPHTLDRFAEAFSSCGFRKSAFYPCYGLAEATLLVTGGPKARGPKSIQIDDTTSTSSGVPQLGVQIAIVDPESKLPCPDGAAGEIWIQSPSVAAGYWNKPEATAETFHINLKSRPGASFLRTGDIGSLRDGELYVSGRIKDLIIIAGVNHFPQDIERTCQESHPALRPGGGAAFSVPGDGRERLVIVYELDRAQRNVAPEEIIAAIRQSVSEQQELQVSSIVLLRPGQLPITSSGKVQRHACREAFLTRRFSPIAQWDAAEAAPAPAPTRPACAKCDARTLEAFLAQRMASALAVDLAEIDPAEPFARYGLDSIKAATLANELESQVGREVPVTLFWDYPSISALAGHLAEQLKTVEHANS